VCHVPGPRGNSLGYFCPSRASSQRFSQASGASRSQHRLSSFLLTKDGSRGCNAVGCANTNEHRPTNTRNSFSAPEAVLSEVEQRFDCVQAQTHMYPSLVDQCYFISWPHCVSILPLISAPRDLCQMCMAPFLWSSEGTVIRRHLIPCCNSLL